MELPKSEFSSDRTNMKLNKLLLNCNDPNYYKLTNFLYISQNKQALVLNALYNSKINVVLKFGFLDSIEKEFKISEALSLLPNFIRFFCSFSCNDNIRNIIDTRDNITKYKICQYGSKPIGVLVMKDYAFGSICDYDWNRENFHILKNVIKQVAFASILAYNFNGFIKNTLFL
jgi:hypothetical protein